MSKNEPDYNELRGVVINTSGTDGFTGTFGRSATAAASGAIKSLTRPLAIELAESGIRVVNIATGFMKTPLNDYIPSATAEHINTQCILSPNRFGNPDEFAYLVQSIVNNPYINATTIELSGGIQMPT